ncbi:carbohydrate binding domain-containing protein [bacterium]|nr:carbohydrate binding domain-containing protein [bacterium]
MTLKTHALLATVATVAIIALIHFRSNRSDDSRLKSVMEKTKDLQTAVTAAPVAKTEKPKAEVPKTEIPEEEKPVVDVPAQPAAEKPKVVAKADDLDKPSEKPSEEDSQPVNDDYLMDSNAVMNGSFKDGLANWRYWRLDEEKGKKFVKTGAYGLSLEGQPNTLMGVAQTVKVTPGTVYRLSAKVRSTETSEGKSYLGARLALNAPDQKEQQVVWLYNNKNWEEKEVVFTNDYSGLATLFFHTGYTTNKADCVVKEIALVPENPYPSKNICSSNGDFKEGTKGWNFWQITEAEASNLITRVSEGDSSHIVINGLPGKRLMGMAQAVNVVSGTVYKLSAKVKSQDKSKLLGARVALYAPNQKERQLLWPYGTKDWEEQTLVFTNSFSGAATLYFHTGYTTNSCTALFKDLSLIKRR